MHSDKTTLTRREALKAGLAAAPPRAASSAGRASPSPTTRWPRSRSAASSRPRPRCSSRRSISPTTASTRASTAIWSTRSAKEMGVKVSYLDLPWTSVLPGLDAKKFDLCIAPVTITKERMKRYAFTVPIADATAALMKRANDASIMKPEDIAGKTVGGQKGTSQVEQLKAFAAKLPKPVEVKEYVDNNQSYADLAAGRIDASVNSLPNLAYAAAQRSDAFAVVLPPFGQPTYFSWVGAARRQVADRRGQRRDPQGRGATGRWRRSRRNGSARRWICRRPCPNLRSDPSPRGSGQRRPSPRRPMQPAGHSPLVRLSDAGRGGHDRGFARRHRASAS